MNQSLVMSLLYCHKSCHHNKLIDNVELLNRQGLDVSMVSLLDKSKAFAAVALVVILITNKINLTA